MNGAHDHVLFVLGHLISYIELLFITVGAHSLLLVLESLHVVARRRALVAHEETALSAMMSPSKEIESLLTYLTVLLHLIWYPF